MNEEQSASDPRILISVGRHMVVSESRRQALLALGATYDDGFDGPFITAAFNWAPYSPQERDYIRTTLGQEAFKSCGFERPDEPALPDGVPATITVTVSVNQLNERDVNDMARHFKHYLRDAIRNCPSPEEAPGMSWSLPRQRHYLLNAQEEAFRTDLRRYVAYTKRGLSFRHIAALEENGTPTDGTIDPQTLKRATSGIGSHPPRTEAAVRWSVKRTYEAIHLKPFYRARRRRIDAPGDGLAPYHCSIHDNDCPSSCQYLVEWMGAANRTLPSPTTAKAGGEVTLTEGDRLLHARRRTARR